MEEWFASFAYQITLPGMCSSFGWDKDGDLLAIITDKSPNLIIWDAHSDSGKELLIDTSKMTVGSKSQFTNDILPD